MPRLRTISKHFDDSEILFKDPITGDLHLKEGVKRRRYNDDINPDTLESHINTIELNYRKTMEKLNKLRDGDEN